MVLWGWSTLLSHCCPDAVSVGKLCLLPFERGEKELPSTGDKHKQPHIHGSMPEPARGRSHHQNFQAGLRHHVITLSRCWQVPTSPFQMDPPPSPQQPSGSYGTLSGSGAPSLEHLAPQQVSNASVSALLPLPHAIMQACACRGMCPQATSLWSSAMPMHLRCHAALCKAVTEPHVGTYQSRCHSTAACSLRSTRNSKFLLLFKVDLLRL